MHHIGGEQELTKKPYFRDVTNSGRSSLRLIVESANLEGKRMLLPNFLCEVIIDVLLEYNVEIDFYEVGLELEFQLPVNLLEYDALYLIKYFGSDSESFQRGLSNFTKCIIVDDVFSPYPHILNRESKWFSYNSLRKISQIADFSLIYSNVPTIKIDKLILSSFSSLKYEAKYLKNKFLTEGVGDENEYLSLFCKAETLLDDSRGIYRASEDSICEAIEFHSRLESEKHTRKNNYDYLKKTLGPAVMDIDAEFYSFLPLLLNNRNDVRRKLMADNIFLAIHWPNCELTNNKLSGCILSIPLDCRYGDEELQRLCASLINSKIL